MYILGIDIGGTRLKLARVDHEGTILDRRIKETPTTKEFSPLQLLVNELIDGLRWSSCGWRRLQGSN
jgi:predicted NBD/HSP70 family sugar kinase